MGWKNQRLRWKGSFDERKVFQDLEVGLRRSWCEKGTRERMMEDMSSGRPGIRVSAFEVRVRVSCEEEEEEEEAGEIGISSFLFIFVVCVRARKWGPIYIRFCWLCVF